MVQGLGGRCRQRRLPLAPVFTQWMLGNRESAFERGSEKRLGVKSGAGGRGVVILALDDRTLAFKLRLGPRWLQKKNMSRNRGEMAVHSMVVHFRPLSLHLRGKGAAHIAAARNQARIQERSV